MKRKPNPLLYVVAGVLALMAIGSVVSYLGRNIPPSSNTVAQ